MQKDLEWTWYMYKYYKSVWQVPVVMYQQFYV